LVSCTCSSFSALCSVSTAPLLDERLQPHREAHVISYGLTKIAKGRRSRPSRLRLSVATNLQRRTPFTALFSDSAPSAPPRISELPGDCVAEDSENRGALADIAADVSWVGAVGDRMLAYIDSLSVCTPKEEFAQESEIALPEMGRPDDPQPSDLPEPDGTVRPLFSDESHEDYVRSRKELDVIFAPFFLEWTDRSYRCKVLPLAEIPRRTITRWWRNSEKNHDCGP
jgi:hypothetical protein